MKWSITATKKQSGIYILDDFLSAKECADLIAYLNKHGSKRVFKDPIETHLYATASRNADATIAKVHKRVCQFTGLPEKHLESLVLIDYELNEAYKYHNDFEPNKSKEASPIVAQVLMFLTDVKSGGGTAFPNMGLQVAPKKGRAIFWYGVQGMAPPQKAGGKASIPKTLSANKYAVHSPMPVVNGKKIIAVLGFHQNEYYPIKEVRVSVGSKSVAVPADQMEEIKILIMKDVGIAKKQLSKKDKALKPGFDKITFHHHLRATPDLELKVIGMRDGCLIYEDSRFTNVYRMDTTNGELFRLITGCVNESQRQ